MFKINRDIFFKELRKFEGGLSQQQVNGITFILDSAEQDRALTNWKWLAYMLATTKRETGHTYQPIHEYGNHNYFVKRYGSQTRIGRQLGNDTPEEGNTYSGEGDVQLTGETNYEKAEAALRREYPELVAAFEKRTGKVFDLTVGDQPNDQDDVKNAGDPAIAYAIMSYGMRTGLFTGHKLSDFINDRKTDYFDARTIINDHDHAQEIADYAVHFERIIRASLVSSAPNLVEVPSAGGMIIPNDPEPDPAIDIPVPVVADPDNDPDPAPEPKNDPSPDTVPAITNIAGGDINQSNADSLKAAQALPDTVIETKGNTGFLAKISATITAIVTGQYIVPEFIQNKLADINLFDLIGKLANGLWNFRYIIFGSLAVWFIIVQAKDFFLKHQTIKTNTDPLKGNVILVTPARVGLWNRIMSNFR